MTRKSLAIILLALFVVSACNLSAPAGQDPNALSTAAAQTVEAVLTPLASPTVDGPPAGSPGFAATQTAAPNTAIDGTTAEAVTCNDQGNIIKWERDGKNYDKTEADKPIPPGSSFVISLTLQNTGDCLWTSQYKVFLDSGTSLTDENPMSTMQSGFSVKPGEAFALNMQFKAPSEPGTYNSSFKITDENGKGVMFFGIITTVGSPISQSLNSPGDLRYLYDCTGGVVNITLNWQDRSNDEAGFRIYRDGEKVGEVASGSTSYSEIAPSVGTYEYTVAAFNTTGEAPTNVTVSTSACQ